MKPDAGYFLYSSEIQALTANNATSFTIVVSEEKVFFGQPIQQSDHTSTTDVSSDKEHRWS